VDGRRLGITGISWGGYLTCIVMSLDDRLKVAAPVYGCGFLPENSVWLPILGQLPAGERPTWIEHFEPSPYLPPCTTLVLVVTGTNDSAYPLDSYQKSYRATNGPHTLCITVNMPHGHPAGWAPVEIGFFMDHALKPRLPGPALPRIRVLRVGEGKVTASYDSM